MSKKNGLPGSVFARKDRRHIYVKYKGKTVNTHLDKNLAVNWKKAEKYLEALHENYLVKQGMKREQVKSVGIKDAASAYIKHLEMLNYSKRTIAVYKATLKLFSSNYPIDEKYKTKIGMKYRLHDDIEKKLLQSDYSEITKHNYLATIRKFLEYCKNNGLTTTLVNIDDYRVRSPKIERPVQIFTDEEMEELIQQARTSVSVEFSLLLRFMLLYGLRISEAVDMKFSQVKSDVILIPNKINKNKHDELPLTDEGRQIIERLRTFAKRRGEKNDKMFRWSSSSSLPQVYHNFKMVKLMVGIRDNRGFHSIRKTFITKLERNKVTALQYHKLSRHKDISMSKHYIAYDNSELGDIISNISHEKSHNDTNDESIVGHDTNLSSKNSNNLSQRKSHNDTNIESTVGNDTKTTARNSKQRQETAKRDVVSGGIGG